jgi:multiple sugar transport system permease protein
MATALLTENTALARRHHDTLTAYSFVLPTILILSIVILYPFLTAIWISFTNKSLGGKGEYIGIENFRQLLMSKEFLRAFFNSFYYTLSSVFLKLIIGMITALILVIDFPFKGVIRVMIILPWAISPYIAALTWRWIFDDYNGFFNIILMRNSLINEPIYWLSDPRFAMISVIIAATWQGYPFYTMMILAGLVTIPRELYEAVEIDGGGRIQRFFAITLPSITNILITTVLLSFIWTFNQFQYVYTMTGGGPGGLTHILSTLTFKYGIEMRNISLASAVSITALPVFAIMTVYLTRTMLKND